MFYIEVKHIYDLDYIFERVNYTFIHYTFSRSRKMAAQIFHGRVISFLLDFVIYLMAISHPNL